MTPAKTFRLLTYNVHRCRGTDRLISPQRVAHAIAETNADIVALQELDVNRARTGWADQARLIADMLAMDYHFHPAFQIAEERFGDAVLTRFPLKLVHAAKLPGHPRGWQERRGALWVSIEVDGRAIQVVNTHLGLVRHERETQTEALFGPQWLGNPDCRPPLVLCGDFNALPGSLVHRRCLQTLRDVHRCLGLPRPRQTYPTRLPLATLDHVFLSAEFQVNHVEVVRTDLTRVASDHYPLLVEMNLP